MYENIKTLRELYEFATDTYQNAPMSEMLDSDQMYTYSSFRAACDEMSARLSAAGIAPGEKVAIYSQNMPNWTLALFSAVAFGRVSVPILSESSGVEVENILKHSETTCLFVSRAKLPIVPQQCLDAMKLVICLDDLSVISDHSEGCEPVHAHIPEPEDMAGLFYTSGTTGKAKGVMLSHRNLSHMVIVCWRSTRFKTGYRGLSILPMAHTYEMSLSLLYPFYMGGCMYYIKKAPTTSVLVDALSRVKPQVICSVPLIIEKVYRSAVRKTIDKSKILSWMEKHCRRVLYFLIGRKIKKFFGGELIFFGIGGAKLDPVVEKFLKEARFPYAPGYGLTETAPLITYSEIGHFPLYSIGEPVYGIEVRLGDPDPATGEGEIQVKGPNVMMGYYKDPERTASVFTEDGWFRTGDLAARKGKFLFIRGRIGTMIVGASGENIYPEEIESVINDFSGVNESLVVKREGKLVALVKFDESVLNWDQEREDKFFEMIETKKKEVMDFVNNRVKKSNNINDVEIVKEPFIKTATLKIRRFLYEKTGKADKAENLDKKSGKKEEKKSEKTEEKQ